VPKPGNSDNYNPRFFIIHNSEMFETDEIARYWKNPDKARIRTEIMLKYMQVEREKFVERSVNTPTQPIFENVLGGVVVMGTIVGIPMHLLLEAKHMEGFRQRGLDMGNGSELENSIRDNGWNVAIGSIAIVEIPWTGDEVVDCIKRNVVPAGWTPPERLALDQNGLQGSMIWHAHDQRTRLGERRFGLIDGNNRIHTLNIILKQMPDFLDSVSLNAHVLSLDVYDPLSVQLAGMQLNGTVGHHALSR
jgi:hypothetical protein